MQKKLLLSVLTSLIVLLISYNSPGIAQSLPSDISTLKMDTLSDRQVTELLNNGRSMGYSDEQIIDAAKKRGLTDEQANILRNRIVQLKRSEDKSSVDNRESNREIASAPSLGPIVKPETDPTPKIFGKDLFTNSNMTFQPNLRLATPVNYVLGPDDQLNISVYGNSLASWKLSVSPEGNINIPNVGILNVAGKTIEQATKSIRALLTANKFDLGPGSSLQITLGDIRTISVTINGEVVKPGTYSLSSLSTVFNALYASGGPNANGSFRQIEIIRNNRLFKKLDVYDFLVKGDQRNNISLKDQDIIRVPVYRLRVEIAGEIKRPAFYEMLAGENLADLINFSGGFTDLAYTKKIKVLQVDDQERSIADVLESEISSYMPLRGDKYIVDKILESFRNRVTINGAVIRPGDYELEKGLTISKLITKASGLRRDAYTNRGSITRIQSDNTPLIIPFNVKEIVNKTTSDILLIKEDVISISSVSDVKDAALVFINGQVRRPGSFDYADSLTVEDLILKAGGLTDAAETRRIEVSRRIDNVSPNDPQGTFANVFTVTVDNELAIKGTRFSLRPFDIVSVYAAPGFKRQATVAVEGEVVYPGNYTLINKNERISDLIKKSGGITSFAFIEGGTLKRNRRATTGFDDNKADTAAIVRERAERLNRISALKDSNRVNSDFLMNGYVGIDLKDILKRPGSDADLLLQEGDVLRIPKQLQTVRVNGEVLYSSDIVYHHGRSFKDYIRSAGGFSEFASKRRSYVVYPNGSVKSSSKFLFFDSYPDVKPGSEIYVPKKRPRRGLSTQEFVGLSSGLIGIGAIVLGILSLRK